MTGIIVLLIIGLLLLIAELVLIPGGIVGIIGIILTIIAVIQAFVELGTRTGTIFLGISFFSFLLILYFCFKFDLWSMFALKQKIDARVNEGKLDQLNVGETGKALSALRPSGNAAFNNSIFEVQTQGSFCPAGTEVKIIKIEDNKIIVEPTK